MTKIAKKRTLWIALPLVAVLGIGVAAAGFKQYGGHHNPERMVQRISDRLDLTPEQKDKLEVVKEALVESRDSLRQERADTIEQIIAEVEKPEMNEDRIMAMIEERKSKIDVIAPRMVGPVIEFHKSLDDEQREKIVNLLNTMRDWGWGHGRRRHG